MADWGVLFVSMVIAALLAKYCQESFMRARMQRRIASELQSHLMACCYSLFDEPYHEYFFLGHVLEEKQVMAAVTEKGKEILKAKKDFKNELHELKIHIEVSEEELHDSIEKRYRFYRDMSSESFSHTMNKIKKEGDTLKKKMSVISDQEASVLSGRTAHCAVEMKDHLFAIADKTLDVTVALRKMESFNISGISKELQELMVNIVLFSGQYLSVLRKAQKASKRFLLAATIRNMLLMRV